MTADLDTLPRPADRRLAVRVTRDALRQIRGGHPWVYAESILSVSHDGAPGDLAVVFDDRRRFAAIGLWDPTSPIRLRVLHQGKATPIDETFWGDRLRAALALRVPLRDDPGTDAYRCVHGENDALPGLILDRYGAAAVLKLYTAAWLPHLHEIVPAIAEQLGSETLIVRFSRSIAPDLRGGLAEGAALIGTTPSAPVRFLENGLDFEADLVAGHKTGHFLDQRENRQRVRGLAEGASMLDVFACTGGFSVHAAAGGAVDVHSVDISEPALATARRILDRNRTDPAVAACRHKTTTGDAFEVLADLRDRGRSFDLVVVDPPSFAGKASAVPGAIASYGRLAGLAASVVTPGGVLVQSSCSSRVTADQFHTTIQAAVRSAGRELDVIERTRHALDHPVGFAQGAYLKSVFAIVD